jgi:cyanate permease
MYAPSLFTGHLIRRFGIVNVMLTGILLIAFCIAVNVAGHSISHLWSSMLLLGVCASFFTENPEDNTRFKN